MCRKGFFNRMIIEDHDIVETIIDDDDVADDTEHESEYVHVMSNVRSIVTVVWYEVVVAAFLPDFSHFLP